MLTYDSQCLIQCHAMGRGEGNLRAKKFKRAKCCNESVTFEQEAGFEIHTAFKAKSVQHI